MLVTVFYRCKQAWESAGLTQEDFMYKDECIILDENDNVIGHDNKYNTHRFNPATVSDLLQRCEFRD